MRFTTTDADGHFELHSCPDHESRVCACTPGNVLVATAVAERARPGPGEVRRIPEPALNTSVPIAGRVLDRSGRTLANASVSQRHANLVRAEPTWTEAGSGRFELRPPSPGTWCQSIEVRGHPAREIESPNLFAGETWDAGDVPLGEAGTLRVAVFGEQSDRHIPWIELFCRDGTTHEWNEPSPEGLASGPLEPGTHPVMPSGSKGVARARGLRYCTAAGEVPDGPLRVRLFDAAGELVSRPPALHGMGERLSFVYVAPRSHRVSAECAGQHGELALRVGSEDLARAELVRR